jgi:hypothetical protein
MHDNMRVTKLSERKPVSRVAERDLLGDLACDQVGIARYRTALTVTESVTGSTALHETCRDELAEVRIVCCTCHSPLLC